MRIESVRRSNEQGDTTRRDETRWDGECETRLCGQAERVLDCRSPLCPTHPPTACRGGGTHRSRPRDSHAAPRWKRREEKGGGGGVLERGARESDPPAIFNEASIKKETARLCSAMTFWSRFFPSRVLSCTAAFSHPRALRDPTRHRRITYLPRIALRIFFSRHTSLSLHFIKCLSI